MATRPIVTLGAPVLRQKAKKIHRVDDSIQRLVDDLIDSLDEAGGIGLAAPQIGVPLRAIITKVDDTLHVMINPELEDVTGDIVEADEGCLSIPGWYGPVKRQEQVTVRGLNRKGRPIKVKTEGLEARCFQHEIDHLDGVLFIDRMDDRSQLHRVETAEEEEELEAEQIIT